MGAALLRCNNCLAVMTLVFCCKQTIGSHISMRFFNVWEWLGRRQIRWNTPDVQTGRLHGASGSCFHSIIHCLCPLPLGCNLHEEGSWSAVQEQGMKERGADGGMVHYHNLMMIFLLYRTNATTVHNAVCMSDTSKDATALFQIHEANA